MSIMGILGSSFFQSIGSKIQSNMQQSKQAFQQLGQDLQSGNLSAAQADFSSLTQLQSQISSTSSSSSTSAATDVSQDFNKLSQDLKAGNISAAQQDYQSIQQDFQNLGSQTHRHHHHHHSNSSSGSSEVSQAMSQLSQALQSGNMTAAQQAYGTLQQDLQLLGINGTPATQASSSSTGLSVTA